MSSFVEYRFMKGKSLIFLRLLSFLNYGHVESDAKMLSFGLVFNYGCQISQVL